ALVVLALALPWLARRASPALERLHTGSLALVVLLGFGLWTNSNWQNRRYFNPYEFFHYYVGAKYAPELGYTRLYDAAVLVDRETDFPHRASDLANLSAHRGGPEYKPLATVYAEAQTIRAPFTSARWAEFTRDVSFFRSELKPEMWEQLLHDKGYNATPVWTLLGGRLAHWVPATSRASLRGLVALDVLLLVGAIGCVVWAFGLRAALFSAALYLTHHCSSHAHFRAAFLRTDWLFALVASLCCLKRERPFTGGLLLAWSALLRVFPLLFAAGPLLVVGWSLCAGWTRRADLRRRSALRFAAGFALAGALLFGASLTLRGGLESWQDFQAKIVEHDERPASDTIGFKKLFTWSVGFRRDQGKELRARFEELRPLWWTAQALFVAGLAWLVRKRPLHEALGLSFALVWCLATPAYYYYAFLLVPLLWFAERSERVTGALGLALVFASGLLARAFQGGATFQNYFAFKLSAVMGVLALYLVVSAVLEERGRPRSAAPA
ncbi:MAG: hypothetical protein HOP15_05595, partial [Planctomycetes bacterium]|nr:hypothetical protein [Planctomycetota bacterium]